MMTGNRRFWTSSARTLVLALVFGAVLALLAAPALAQQPAVQPTAVQKKDDYDQVLERYLQAARAVPASADNQWAAGLFADLRARRVNDLVTVRVVENINASGSADSALDKKSSASASVTKLFGAENRFPGWLDPTSLAALGANTGFTGSGATNRAGSLTAVITTRVVEVLPNSDLVLEGIREVDINGDRQFIVLSGIVRASDIGPGNVVPSTAVGQMQIRYF
ncbi:MAG TPA: flagellar basal body L-ring protein FlgH, partial [Methylomirabilota bacterium]|nr:flagellar basal body L-ring protein FlgH [Methylomirabilota bacterium]